MDDEQNPYASPKSLAAPPVPQEQGEDHRSQAASGVVAGLFVVISVMGISVVGLLVGASVLFACVLGPMALFAGPLLAIFGWFYLLPIAIGVSILWAIHDPRWHGLTRGSVFVGVSGVCGTLLMVAIGIRGPELEWLIGYSAGGFVAAAVCAVLVTLIKPKLSIQWP